MFKVKHIGYKYIKESLIKLIAKLVKIGRRNCVRMFREVSSNSYSIAAIFGEDTGDFNKPKIIGLDQSFLKGAGIHPV